MKKLLAVIVSGCFVVSIHGMGGDRIKEDLYKVLGVAQSASMGVIKKAYRRLALKYHPDRNHGKKIDQEKIKLINAAKEILLDKEKRKEYDTGKLFGSFLDDMMEDMMGDFGVDTYSEELDEDYIFNSDDEFEDDFVVDTSVPDYDTFNEELYQQEGARLCQQLKFLHISKVQGKLDQPKLISGSRRRTFKRLRKKRNGRVVDSW